MPLPPRDFSEFHTDMGVRREMLLLSPMAKFVPPHAMLALQRLRDSGNTLVLLLTDSSWMHLACLDETGARYAIQHAMHYTNRKLVNTCLRAAAAPFLGPMVVMPAPLPQHQHPHPHQHQRYPPTHIPAPQTLPPLFVPPPPPSTKAPLPIEAPLSVAPLFVPPPPPPPVVVAKAAPPPPPPPSVPLPPPPPQHPRRAKPATPPSSRASSGPASPTTAATATAVDRATGGLSSAGGGLSLEAVRSAICHAILHGGGAVTKDTFRPHAMQLDGLGPALAAKAVREFMRADGWRQNPDAALRGVLCKYGA